jgi:hypothetical protein
MRLNKVPIFFLFLVVAYQVKGQNERKSKLEQMQGIWYNIINTDSEKAYTIIKEHHSLNFVYNTTIDDLNFPLNESIEGFYDGDVAADSLNVKSLNKDGLHYIIIDTKGITPIGWVHKRYYLTPDYFECDGELMSINGGQLVEYSKIDELPFDALTRLYKRGRLDKRDYVKEYLNLKILSIKRVKSRVYSERNKEMKVGLNKDHLVVVIEEIGQWLKVKYGEREIGWIRKDDTN